MDQKELPDYSDCLEMLHHQGMIDCAESREVFDWMKQAASVVISRLQDEHRKKFNEYEIAQQCFDSKVEELNEDLEQKDKEIEELKGNNKYVYYELRELKNNIQRYFNEEDYNIQVLINSLDKIITTNTKTK